MSRSDVAILDGRIDCMRHLLIGNDYTLYYFGDSQSKPDSRRATWLCGAWALRTFQPVDHAQYQRPEVSDLTSFCRLQPDVRKESGKAETLWKRILVALAGFVCCF